MLKAAKSSTRRNESLSGDGLDFADPQTGVAKRRTLGCNVRSKCRCSMCPAIHINSRSWLRSSSTHEPSDPPPKVVSFFNFFFSFLGEGGKEMSAAEQVFHTPIEFCKKQTNNFLCIGNKMKKAPGRSRTRKGRADGLFKPSPESQTRAC